MDRDNILSELEDSSSEGQEQDFKEAKQIREEPEIIKKKPAKKNKKLVYAGVIAIGLITGGFLAYKHLFKAPQLSLTKSAQLFTPPVPSSGRQGKGNIISDLYAKPAGLEVASGEVPAKGGSLIKKEPVAIKNRSNLNDLFAIKYKKPAKRILTALPGQMPVNNFHQMPSYNPGVNLPSINAIKNKLKNIDMGAVKSSPAFIVLGASGSYVAVRCGAVDNYLKIGDSACGRTLLRTSASSAKFVRNGKIKSYAY